MLVEVQGENMRKQEDKTREEKWRQEKSRVWSTLIFFSFQNCTFWTCIKKEKSTHSFFGAWSFLSVHIQFVVHGHSSQSTFSLHLVRGKLILFYFLKFWSWKTEPSSHTMKKGHIPWFNLMIYGVNWPLVFDNTAQTFWQMSILVIMTSISPIISRSARECNYMAFPKTIDG
jgi:hypothetical protein